jgi:hypothetical protein
MMEILSELQLSERVNYKRPMQEEPEKPDDAWPIPFEYGANIRGTRISIGLAKTISAELRAEVAEAEKRQLYHHFKYEERRANDNSKRYADEQLKVYELQGEVTRLKRKLRTPRKKRQKGKRS